MTDDLVAFLAFLRKRIAEDSLAAIGTLKPALQVGIHRGKAVPRWELTPGGGIVDSAGTVRVRFPYEAEAAHIVRHDPWRVLAEVDAKQRMIDEYSTTVRLRDEADARIKAAWPTPDAKDLDTWTRAQREAAIMHDWVLLLALPFREHPDYQPDWAPQERTS